MTDKIPFNKYRPHPWHGLAPGSDPPRLLQAYIEITPFDPVKYEIDKASGYLRVDRPQRSSSLPPAALYGFVPRTYCGPLVAALSPEVTQADGDPLDICVLSERPINRAEILVDAVVVGGLRAIDNGVADDKIIAVLLNDNIWGTADDITDIPQHFVERLQHYFSTYKMIPGHPSTMVIMETYGVARAQQVVRAAMADYLALYGQQSAESSAQHHENMEVLQECETDRRLVHVYPSND
jgi:inorganic pyrophosphatase